MMAVDVHVQARAPSGPRQEAKLSLLDKTLGKTVIRRKNLRGRSIRPERPLDIPLQYRPESWNMTVPQPQSLEKKENQPKSSEAHIPTF